MNRIFPFCFVALLALFGPNCQAAVVTEASPARVSLRLETGPPAINTLESAIANLPHIDAISYLWGRELGGYWATPDQDWIGFKYVGVPQVAYGKGDTRPVFGELIDAYATGDYQATLTVLYLPESIVIIDLDLTGLVTGWSFEARIDAADWITYLYAGPTR